jgi:hypothetical protein
LSNKNKRCYNNFLPTFHQLNTPIDMLAVCYSYLEIGCAMHGELVIDGE